MTLPRDMTPSEVAAARATDPGLVYLDVRSSMEFASGHPPGAVNVPLAEFDPNRGMIPNPKFVDVVKKLYPAGTPLILGCASGGRSKQAQMVLAQSGYSDLCNMLGGFSGGMGPSGPIPGWASSGLQTATDGISYKDAKEKAGL